MARDQDSPARKRGMESATTWVLAALGVGMLAVVMVLASSPTGNEGVSTEQVVPNTPPPVRVE